MAPCFNTFLLVPLIHLPSLGSPPHQPAVCVNHGSGGRRIYVSDIREHGWTYYSVKIFKTFDGVDFAYQGTFGTFPKFIFSCVELSIKLKEIINDVLLLNLLLSSLCDYGFDT